MWYNLTLGIGTILLITALLLFRNTLAFLKISERTIGTVIDLERVHDSDGDTYKPVFTYKTNRREERTYRHFASSNPPSFKIGEEATIAYDPNDPSSVKILTYFGTFSWTIVLLAIAMPMLVIGGGYHVAQYFLR